MTVAHLVSRYESVGDDGIVGDRASVGEVVQSREMVIALPPGCLLVTMVDRVPLLGSGAYIGWVIEGYSRGVGGGLEGPQPLGLGPR